MSSKWGDKISTDHGLIPGLYPILLRLCQWPEVVKIVPMKIRGNQKAHSRTQRHGDIKKLRFVHVTPSGIKIMAVGADARQQVALCGPIGPLTERFMEFCRLREKYPLKPLRAAVGRRKPDTRRAGTPEVVPAPSEVSIPAAIVASSMVEVTAEPEPPVIRKRRGRMAKDPSQKKVAVTAIRLMDAAKPKMLVSVELEVLKKTLGHTATPVEIRSAVEEIRSLPWEDLMARYEA